MKHITDLFFPEITQWEGSDASLEESLFEYGMIWSAEPGENGFAIIYEVSRTRSKMQLGCAVYAEDTDPEREWNWIKPDAWEGFFRTHGTTREEWMGLPITAQVHDLTRYFGAENIFGTEYYPQTVKLPGDFIEQ